MSYGDEVISDDLYRQIILDHYTNPRNTGCLEHPSFHLEGTNPTCGDTLELDLIIEDGIVKDVAYEGTGCSISMASASMLTEAIKGQKVEDALKIAHAFKARLLSKDEPAEDVDIGELEALDGVKAYPVRIKCALLSWNTLLEAIDPNAPKMPGE